MQHIGLLNTIFLTLLLGFGLLIVTAAPRELAPVARTRPATVLAFVASRLRVVQSYVGDFARALWRAR